jgi:hypothetical protein
MYIWNFGLLQRDYTAVYLSISRRPENLKSHGCFIVHRESIQLLGIDICFQLLSQHKHRHDRMRAWQWLGLQSYRQVRTGRTTCRIKLLWGKYFFFGMDSRIECRTSFICTSLSHGVLTPTTPHSSQGFFSAFERTVDIAKYSKEKVFSSVLC